MDGGIKKKYSTASTNADIYGVGILEWGEEKPTYETYIGLYLNKERVLFRRSVPVMIAVGQAFSGKMSREWYEAITDIETDAEKLASKMDKNTDIQKLKALAKKGREKHGNTR